MWWVGVGGWGGGAHVDGLVVALQLAAVALHQLRSKVLVRAWSESGSSG